ncbi:MAG: PAS domain-containing protein [Bacteroidales bacterium]|nr:PAS domain-containing protein [Bacteroidales bacterium]
MSEFINNIAVRREELIAFSVGIINGGKRKDYIKRYQTAIDNLTAEDVIFVTDKLIEKYNVEIVKENIGKILNIFYEPLKKLKRTEIEGNSFLYFLEKENREAEKILKNIKELLKKINKSPNALSETKEQLKSYFVKFQEFEKHYSKKENIFFSYFEKKYENHTCLKVMWAFHDEIRDSINKNIEILEGKKPDLKLLNKETGRFFFAVIPVIFREEHILHPFALELFSKKEFNEMLLQSFEIGFAFIKTPEKPDIIVKEEIQTTDYSKLGNLFADLETGILSHEQIKMMINHLPVDITFVDEDDTVRFFSNPKHRFFTRSKAIIGRTVQNCHPHESVHIVDEIVDSFKTGKKDKARFWIQMKGRFILIEYYALRNNKGEYKGTIEVSQDITELRQLKGEQRLLDWKK